MKNIITLTLLLLASNLFGQFKTIDYVDEFGDLTGESGQVLIVTGHFSNSATSKSKAKLKITKGKTSYLFTITLYDNTPETFISGEYEYGTITFQRPGEQQWIDYISIGRTMLYSKFPTFKSRKRAKRKGNVVFMADLIKKADVGDKIVITVRNNKYWFKIGD